MLIIAFVAYGRFAVDQSVSNEASDETSQSEVQTSIPLARVASVPLNTETDLKPVEIDISQELQTLIDGFAEEHDASISINIQALDESFSASHNPELQQNAASLYKTLAAYKVLQLVDDDQLSMQTKTSTGRTIEDCIELAITVSDNPCGMVLQSLARSTETDEEALDWGYDQTTLSGYFPQTSALDQHKLLSDIYLGQRLSDESQEFLLDQLANQQITNRTPEYEDTKLYLKTGNLGGAVHSAALVETPTVSYTISVLTSDWSESLLSKYSAISDIHESTHKAITQ